jgi:serine/threonine protein kinase
VRTSTLFTRPALRASACPRRLACRNSHAAAGLLLAIGAADFGCAKVAGDDEVINDVAGSPYYCSPEVLSENYVRTGRVWKAADMWSVGVIIFLLVSGYPPFNGDSQVSQVDSTEAQINPQTTHFAHTATAHRFRISIDIPAIAFPLYLIAMRPHLIRVCLCVCVLLGAHLQEDQERQISFSEVV